MVTERQRAFRQEYRSRINGLVRRLICTSPSSDAMGAAAFTIYLQHLHSVTALEWLTIPVTFLFTNVFEWAVHRFVIAPAGAVQGAARRLIERHRPL